MKTIIIYIVLSFACISCGTNNNDMADAINKAVSSTDTSVRSLQAYKKDVGYFLQADTQFVCYYEMGEKYFSDTVSEIQKENWRQSLLKEISSEEINQADNIFKHNGGGPAGAEWNMDANLFCVLFIRNVNYSLVPYTVKLNDILLNTVVKDIYVSDSTNKPAAIVYFTIPSKEWRKALKQITIDKQLKTLTNKFVKVSLTTQRGQFSHTYQGIIKVAYGE